MNYALLSYSLYASQLLLTQATELHIQNILKHSEKMNKHHETLQRIVYQCFSNIIGSFVAIGDWINLHTFLSTTMHSNSKPVYLFDATNSSLKNYKNLDKTMQKFNATKVYPSSNVAIVISSEDTLTEILNDLKKSIWWNHQASFLIINDNQSIGCLLARQFLQIVWNFNILSAIYVCFDLNGQVRMYTFNPYDRLGTVFWRVTWVSDSADNYWTMFEHSFNESFHLNNESLNCSDLNLERTKNLNQLNIKVGARELKIPIKGLSGSRKEVINDISIVRIILNKLNATYTFKFYDNFGYYSESGSVSYMKDIETGCLTIATNLLLLRVYFTQYSYPYEFNSWCFVTPKNRDVQYLASFALNEWLYIVPASLASIAIIKYALRESISAAVLDFFRMLIGTAFLKRTSNFFLVNAIVGICTFSLFMQIRLTTYKTVPGKGRQIETMEDLVHSNLNVVGQSNEFFYDEGILKKFLKGDQYECINKIRAGQKQACIIFCSIMKHGDYSGFIHEAEERVTTRPIVFPLSRDWPLHSKFNLIMSYLVESGIYQYMSTKYQYDKWSLPKKYPEIDGINMEELWFTFNLYIKVSGVAVIIFFVELGVLKIRKFYSRNK